MRKGFLKSFTKFTGKHLCQSLFFNKFAGLRATTLLKKRLWHRGFPVNFVKFLRKSFLQNTSGRLLLNKYHHSMLVFSEITYCVTENILLDIRPATLLKKRL